MIFYYKTFTMKRLLLFGVLVFMIIVSYSQPLQPTEVSIEMRDNKFLAADLHIHSDLNPRPVILIQTPYNKNLFRYGLPLGVGINFANSHYNFVIVDWRGFYGSASAMVSQPKRGEDGYDIIEWISNQGWCNGKVGTWGPSALGKIQYETAKEQHPAHICAVPLVASPEFLYQSYYPNGVYRKEYLDQLDALGYGLSAIILANPHFNNTWNFIQNNNFYPQSINIPMLLIAGWYDHNIEEMLKYFADMRNLSHISVKNKHKLLVGPWAHGGFGMAHVGTEQQGELFFAEAAGYSNQKANDFFDFYLREIDNMWESNSPVINYFQMGEMTWNSAENWPPLDFDDFKFYLHQNGNMNYNLPENDNSFSEIIYDPRDPSPTIGGATLRNDLLQGPYDQSLLVESRDDIITYTTEVLQYPFRLVGKPTVKLFVASNRTDTDFAIRLCDVYPDNRSILLSEGIFRMRFRNGFTINDTSFINPGTIYEIDIELPNTAHTFMPGHSIRLNISSSNYPRFDNNLNNGGAMYVAGDTLVADNRLYHNFTNSSRLILPGETITYSFENKHNDISIFPVPAGSNEILSIEHIEIIKAIIVYDLEGRIVMLENNINENSLKLNLNSFKIGVYHLRIITERDSFSGRFIVL